MAAYGLCQTERNKQEIRFQMGTGREMTATTTVSLQEETDETARGEFLLNTDVLANEGGKRRKNNVCKEKE